MVLGENPEFRFEPTEPPPHEDTEFGHGEAVRELDEVRLAPPDGKSREELEAEWDERRDRRLPLSDGERAHLDRMLSKRKRGKFSLLEVMAVVTFVSICLSLSSYLPVHVFAGVLGIVMLIALYVLSRLMEESRILRLACWTVAILYIGAAILAVLGG